MDSRISRRTGRSSRSKPEGERTARARASHEQTHATEQKRGEAGRLRTQADSRQQMYRMH